MIPGGKAGEQLKVDVAQAELVNNKIQINYSILSATEMTKLVERAGKGEEIPDIPVFLTENHFNAAALISVKYNELRKLGSDPVSAYLQTANELGSAPERVKLLHTQAMNYYTLGQEQETIQ